jgi:CRP/FNR family cyclic AMP-dependent transcriptional regulator
MSLLHTLGNAPEFKNLSANELEGVEAAMTVRVYRDGHVFIREGEPGDSLFLIIEGEVVATRKAKDGSATLLARMASGDLFGLLALIDEGPRSASCTALGEVVVASLPRRRFEQLYKSQAPAAYTFQYMIARQLVRDVRATNEALIRQMLDHTASEVHEALQNVSVEFRPSRGGEEIGDDESTQ